MIAALALAAGCAAAPPPDPGPACPAPGVRSAPAAPRPADGDAARGAALYADHCAGCHAADAASRRPDAPPAAPRLDCDPWLADASDAYLYFAIARGPGVYGHAGEPPLGLALSPQQVADLVAFLRSQPAR